MMFKNLSLSFIIVILTFFIVFCATYIPITQTKNATKLAFLHIGKCGGGTLENNFKEENIKFKSYHIKKNITHISQRRIVSFVRNPVDRYVSAFNWRYQEYYENNWKIKEIKEFREKELLAFFETADALALALDSTHENYDLAMEAMSIIDHTGESIADYFVSSDVIKQNKEKIIFVGRLEHFDFDYDRLLKILNINKTNKRVEKERKKIHLGSASRKTILSDKAIENLKLFYQKDYQIIQALIDQGFISADYIKEIQKTKYAIKNE